MAKSTLIRAHAQNDAFSYTNSSGSTIAGGAIIRVGGNGGVFARAHDDIANGDVGAVHFAAEIEVDKLNTDVFTIGQEIGWDDTNSRATSNTALGVLGVVSEAAGNGALRVRVKMIPSKQRLIFVNLPYDPGSDVDQGHFIMPAGFNGRVVGITGCPNVGDAGITGVIKKAPSGTAMASGTALHTGTFDFNGTANTNQVLTLSATATDLDIPAGTRIGWDFSGALTNSLGSATVALLV